MKTLEINGLSDKPRTVECDVRVLGKPELFDPLHSDRLPEFDHLFGVSPNGQWMALVRKCKDFDTEIYTIVQAQEGADEIVVPLKDSFDRFTRPRDVANDGMFLYQASVSPSDSLHSRRPFVFKPGDKESTVLPPEYDEESPYSYLDKNPNDHTLSHTPYCFAGSDTVFGWTHTLSSLRERHHDDYELVHCIWRRANRDAWMVEYMPEFLRFKWVWPTRDGKFFCCDWSKKEGEVEFGLFDGSTYKPFKNFAIHGHGCKITAVAADGTCLGHIDVYREKRKEDDCNSCFYTFLARPAAGTAHVFNESVENNVWLTELSENGKYALAEGCEILRAENGGYRHATFTSPGWRIDDTAGVTNNGHVFATATCLERKHGCFRLKLPVLLVPQW